MLQVGVDCEAVSRFRRLSFKRKEKFYKRIFTHDEIRYCLSSRDPYPRFAARFAAKEAAIKALSEIIKPAYIDIEIIKDSAGRPSVLLSAVARAKIKRKKPYIALSITHSRSHAVAFVIVSDSRKVRENASKIFKEGARAAKNCIFKSSLIEKASF